MINAKLRPCFHLFAFCLEFIDRNEFKLRDDLFVFPNLFRRAKQHMHDTKMNLADFGGIIVDQANRPGIELTLNGKLLADLALHGVLKRLHPECKCKERGLIYIIDVATDADGTFGDQALFTGLFAAHIMQNVFAIGDQNVRDDLFELPDRFRLWRAA